MPHPRLPHPWPQVIAHRGAGRLAPENTLAALRHGAALGQRACECDVRLSADGHPFLLHDDTLARTTGHPGLASARTWAELSLLDAGAWHSPAYAGEPPASLGAVLRFCIAQGHALNLELKPNPGQAEHTGAVVAEWLNRLWPPGLPLLLSSFEPEALAGARRVGPGWPRALLIDSPAEPPTERAAWLAHHAVPQAQALGCCAVVAHHPLLDEAAIATLHHHHLAALAYTVNAPQRAQQLLAWGLDALITDAVDVLGGEGLSPVASARQPQRGAPRIIAGP